MACPELDEIVLISHTDTEEINIGSVARTVAARALRRAKLRTVMVVVGRTVSIRRTCWSSGTMPWIWYTTLRLA